MRSGVQSESVWDAADYLLDAKMRAKEMDGFEEEVETLVPKINAGGKGAQEALILLILLSNQPNAKWAMNSAGVEAAAAKFSSRTSTPEKEERLAHSLITLITDLFVNSEISQNKKGSYGYMHVTNPRPFRIFHEKIIDFVSRMQAGDAAAGDYLL